MGETIALCVLAAFIVITLKGYLWASSPRGIRADVEGKYMSQTSLRSAWTGHRWRV